MFCRCNRDCCGGEIARFLRWLLSLSLSLSLSLFLSLSLSLSLCLSLFLAFSPLLSICISTYLCISLSPPPSPPPSHPPSHPPPQRTRHSDCPGSYCQTTGFGPYTCHGSKCGKKSQCEDTCNNNVPTELLGVWRGLEISTKYTSGEFDLKFQQAAPQITVKDNTGKQLTGSVTADALTRTLALKLSDGSTWTGLYKPWEQEPETEDFAFAFTSKSGVDAPSSIVAAMNGGDYFVMSMTKCLKGAANCTFASVFDTKRRRLRLIDNAIVRDNADPTTDPCNQYTSCDTCLNVSWLRREGGCHNLRRLTTPSSVATTRRPRPTSAAGATTRSSTPTARSPVPTALASTRRARLAPHGSARSATGASRATTSGRFLYLLPPSAFVRSSGAK